MSLITVADIAYLPYAGHVDPGLPQRVWAVQVTAPGDGSGGFNSAQINLKSQGVSPGNIFSLEQISIESEDQADLAVEIEAAGMQSFGPDFLSQRWSLDLLANEVDTETFVKAVDARPRLWLGRGASAGPAGTVTLTVNNGNVALNCFVMGYMWTPGAVNTPGGPRRPIEGVFSN